MRGRSTLYGTSMINTNPINRRIGYLPDTKVTPPVTGRAEVPRQQALDRVIRSDHCRLVLVQAPAGFGKTTFMNQLVAHYRTGGMAPSWLTLDPGDNDVSKFLAAFVTSLERVNGERNVGDDCPVRNADIVASIMDLIVESPKPRAIFFDDFESLHNPVVTNLIARGIDALPANSLVVIGTRSLPDIGLARLRVKGVLTEIDGALLRFTIAEVGTFFTQRPGVSLNPQQIEHLQTSTEGWPAALWLASLALERRRDPERFLSTFSGSDTALANYLAEDVLGALPLPLYQFLLRTSVLEELNEPLCNALSNRSDSLNVLLELERLNLFVSPVDERGGRYRYHSLFRGFLLNQLENHHHQELASLHVAASHVFVEMHRPIPAIRHALKARAPEVALPLLYQHVDQLISEGRLRFLASCLEDLPKGELEHHPHLHINHAWCVAFTRGAKEAWALVAALEGANLPAEPAAHLMALRPMLLAMMDRIDEAHEQGMKALPDMDTGYPFAQAMLYQALTQTSIILGLHEDARRFVDKARHVKGEATGNFGLVLAESAEALLDLMGGRLSQSTARLQLTLKNFSSGYGRTGNSNPLAAIQLAEALYECNEVENARRLLETYSPLVQDLGPPDAMISAQVLLSRLVHDEGDRYRALELLTELETTGHRQGLMRVIASARLERSHRWLDDGDEAGALEQINSAEQTYEWVATDRYWFVANDTLTPAISRFRWLIRTGSCSKAIPRIRDELAQADRAKRARRVLKLRILLAEALLRDGQRRMAFRTMTRTLNKAEPDGFVRTFIEEGSTIQEMLCEIRRNQSAEHGALKSSSNDMEHPPPRAMAPGLDSDTLIANAGRDPLTRKELQVLELLARGFSNNAMAERLFVSESTVRTHLRNINLKLHASNRTEAVAIAKEIGILA